MQASKYEGGPISNVNLFFFMIAIFQDGVFWQFWEGALISYVNPVFGKFQNIQS